MAVLGGPSPESQVYLLWKFPDGHCLRDQAFLGCHPAVLIFYQTAPHTCVQASGPSWAPTVLVTAWSTLLCCASPASFSSSHQTACLSGAVRVFQPLHPQCPASACLGTSPESPRCLRLSLLLHLFSMPLTLHFITRYLILLVSIPQVSLSCLCSKIQNLKSIGILS